jgi:hypothetical protein
MIASWEMNGFGDLIHRKVLLTAVMTADQQKVYSCMGREALIRTEKDREGSRSFLGPREKEGGTTARPSLRLLLIMCRLAHSDVSLVGWRGGVELPGSNRIQPSPSISPWMGSQAASISSETPKPETPSSTPVIIHLGINETGIASPQPSRCAPSGLASQSTLLPTRPVQAAQQAPLLVMSQPDAAALHV